MKYVVFRDISNDGVFYNDLEVVEVIPSFEALQQTFLYTDFIDTALSTDDGPFDPAHDMLQATAGGVFTGALNESGDVFRRFYEWTFIPNAETDLLNAPQSALYPAYNNTVVTVFDPFVDTYEIIFPTWSTYNSPSVLFAGSISQIGGYAVQQATINTIPTRPAFAITSGINFSSFSSDYYAIEPSAADELSDQFDFSFDVDIDAFDASVFTDGVVPPLRVTNDYLHNTSDGVSVVWPQPWTLSPDQNEVIPEQLQPRPGVVGIPTYSTWYGQVEFWLNLEIDDLFTQYALGDSNALDDFSVAYIGNKATESSFQTFSRLSDDRYGTQPFDYEEVSILLNFSFSNVDQLDWVIPDNDGFVTLNPLAERLFLDESPNYYGILTGTTPQITIDTGVSAKIFDATGDHSLSIENGASMHFAGAQGHNEFYFDSYSDEWFIRRDGSVVILDSGFDIVEIPVTLDDQTLIFADNVYEIGIDTSAQSADQLVSVYMDLGNTGFSKITTLDLISGARLPQRESDLTAENSPYHFEVYQDQMDSSVWNLDFQWSPEQSPNAVYEISYDVSFEAGSVDASSIIYDLNQFDRYGEEELFAKTRASISEITTDAISNISTFTFTGGYLFNNPHQPQSRIDEANGGAFQFTALTENPVVTISNIHVNELDMELPSSTLVLGENLGAALDAYQGTMQQPYEFNLATLGHGQVIEDDISTESYTRLTNVNFAWDGSSITTPEYDDDGFMTTLDLADHGGWTVQSSEGLVTLTYNNNGIISEIVIEADHVSSSDVLYSLSDLIDIGIEVVGLTSAQSSTVSGYTPPGTNGENTPEAVAFITDTSTASNTPDPNQTFTPYLDDYYRFSGLEDNTSLLLDAMNFSGEIFDRYDRPSFTDIINWEFMKDTDGNIVRSTGEDTDGFTSLVLNAEDAWIAWARDGFIEITSAGDPNVITIEAPHVNAGAINDESSVSDIVNLGVAVNFMDDMAFGSWYSL